MEIDLERAGNDLRAMPERLRSQVCIIGGGLAGLLLAEQLSTHCTVTLLEAGGWKPSQLADPFSAELQGHPHAGTREGRMCALGGCSLTWGGQLMALPSDPGWPVDLSAFSEDGSAWHVPGDFREFLVANNIRTPSLLSYFPELTPRLSRFVPFSRRNLAKYPGRQLLASGSVAVVLHGRVRELVLTQDRDRVASAEVVTPAGDAFKVEAEQFVLAAGTVETCRLMLASQSTFGEGLGNAFGQVGKNFHDHLTISAAVFTGGARARVLRELRPWVLRAPGQRRSVYSLKLEASAELRARLALHRTMAHITIEEPSGSGANAMREWLRAMQSGSAKPRLLKVLPTFTMQALRFLWEAWMKRRRYVSSKAKVQLQINMAQDSPSASRVCLSQGRYASGMPNALVDWRISSAEIQSLRRFAAYLKDGFETAGIREGVTWEPSLLAEGPAMDEALVKQVDDARHAMGGASMGTDPQSSVVDTELRVHGIPNLSVASAAVFPDGSPQLPTLTLRALCQRLAERLRRELA